jgi:hypothetical protein
VKQDTVILGQNFSTSDTRLLGSLSRNWSTHSVRDLLPLRYHYGEARHWHQADMRSQYHWLRFEDKGQP